MGIERALDGRVAVVTGGAQGIGKAIVELFQRAGAQVCLIDQNVERALATVAQCMQACPETEVSFVPAELQSAEQISNAVKIVGERYGRIDVLVNNAGIELDAPFEEISLSAWEMVLAVNLRAPFLSSQAALPLFPSTGGAIVNIASIHATHAFPNSLAYASSKAGLLALTRNLALELSPRNIRVNAINPGYIDTPLWDEFLSRTSEPDRVAQRVTSLHPLRRRGSPSDVARAALYLVTDSSSFITGTQLLVDGGLTIRAHPE